MLLIFVFGGNIFPSSKGADDDQKCTEYKRFNITIMNCTNLRGFKELPEYLSANIQGLNLSNSQVLWSQGINDTFAKFKDSLLLLDNSHTYHSTFNGYAIYRVLTKLEYLDISYTCVYHRGMFDGSFQVFPSSLKILKFNGCPTEHLDIEYLISLEELHMRSNNLKILPRINVKAPFWFLDLAENELVELSPMNFTKLCALREVFLNSTPGHGLNQPKYYCECISLKNWFANKIMKGSISCSSPSPTPDCDTTRLKDANAVYAESCLKRAKWKWWLVLPSILLLLLISILMIAFCVMFVTRDDDDQQQGARNEEPTDAPVEEEEELEISEESTDTMTYNIAPKAVAEMY